MSIPKEPRQQMINIMYLVLTALLALNVSNEIVNAFKLLDKGINASNASIDKKVESSFKQFQAAVEKNPEGQLYLDKATEIQKYADEFIDYVTSIQDTINNRSGGIEGETGWVKKLDEQSVPTKLMVEQGKGDELAAKIKEYREKFLSLFEGEKLEDSKAAFESALLLNVDEVPADAKMKDATWGMYTFNQMPLVSVITLLDKFKNDAKNSASAGIDILKSKVSEEEILFDSFDVAIVPNARKLMRGDTFEAEVFLTASSSASKPRISINGQGKSVDAKGRASIKTPASSVGTKNVNVSISYKDGFGKDKTATKKMTYEVVEPPDHVAVVSPTKMNAFYIGLPNPVAASVTGIQAKDTKVSIDSGQIKKTGTGTYEVNVSSPGTCYITVSGPKPRGGTFSDKVEFRKKRIPDPIPKVGKKAGGGIKSGEFKAQQGLRAALEDFLFDAKFQVTSYEVTLARPRQDLEIAVNRGAAFEGRCKSLVSKAQPGDIYYFDKVKVKAPDNTNRTLASISFKIN